MRRVAAFYLWSQGVCPHADPFLGVLGLFGAATRRLMGFLLGSWRFWAGVAVSVITLAVLVLLVDRQELVVALKSANYLYLAPAVVIYFIGQWFRSMRWQFLLSPVANIPVKRLYPVVIIGYMANNVLPARLGELVRALLLSQREPEVSAPASIATLSVERLYDGLTLLTIGAVAAPVLLAAGLFDGASASYRTTALLLAVGVMLSFVVALAGFTALAVSQRAVNGLITATRILPGRFRPLAAEIIRGFVEGLGTLNSPRKHVTLFLISLPVWLAEAGVYLILAYSFDLHTYFPSFWLLALAVLLVMVTSNLVTAIPASVGGIGPFEVVAQQTLVGLGIGAAAAASYSVAVHLVALWLPVNLVGVVLLLRLNLSLRGLTTLPDSSSATVASSDLEPPTDGGINPDSPVRAVEDD